MFHNVSKADRYIRLGIAAIVFLLYYLEVITGNTGETLMIIAVVLLITSVRRCCPIYALIGRGTCSPEAPKKGKQVIKVKKLDI
jgi:hypothetical protein